MVYKSEPDIWYQVDLVINWELQSVSIYVNGMPQQPAQPFFVKRKTELKSVNAAFVYNLSPGSVCHFKELEICDVLCNNSKSA